MISTTYPARFSSRTDKLFNPGRDRRDDDSVIGKQGLVINPHGCEHAAKAARAAVHMAFGRYAGALDQTDFVDREPWQNLVRAPGAWVR